MELHAEDIVALDGRSKGASVNRGCDDTLGHRSAIGMSEVNERIPRNGAEERGFITNFEIIPSDMRRLHSGRKVLAYPGEESEARNLRCLRASREEPLHSDTDTE